MKRKDITIITLFVVIIGALGFSVIRNIHLKRENTTLINNQNALITQRQLALNTNQMYKIHDSLNAAKVSALRLELSNYKDMKGADFELIKQLKTNKSNLQAVISAQVETINSLQAKIDTTIRFDTVQNKVDTIKCFEHESKWTKISACVNTKNDSIAISIVNNESLKIIETVAYKRFLGFLWRTNRVKNRQIDVVSENPNTKISNVEYITIEP